MFLDITHVLSIKEFELIKDIVLSTGDRQTYRNFDCNSPHLAMAHFHVYLSPSTGQRNIYGDPLLSDFNEIVIWDRTNGIQYYTLKIVREGDTAHEDIRLMHGMKEKHIYLMNPYEKDMAQMEKNLVQIYLPEMRRLIQKKI